MNTFLNRKFYLHVLTRFDDSGKIYQSGNRKYDNRLGYLKQLNLS